MDCNQKGCPEPAEYLVYWPGHPPRPMCGRHRDQAVGVAEAMGFYLHVEPVPARAL